jgi:hypothetical protein
VIVTFYTGTLSTDTGVSTRTAFQTVVSAALEANGWVRVGDFQEADQNSYAGYQQYYRVWRNPSSNSGMPADCYLIMWQESFSQSQTIGDAGFQFRITEDFDTTTSTVKSGTRQDYYSTTTASGLPSWTATAVKPYSLNAGSSLTIATGGQYWMLVSNKRFVITTRSSSNSYSNWHAGWVTNLMPTSIPNVTLPLWNGVLGRSNQYSDGGGGWLREPGTQITAANTVQAFGYSFDYPPNSYYDQAYYGGFVGLKPFITNQRNNMRIIRGTVDGLRVFNDPQGRGPGAFSVGDTITTLDGTVYICFVSGGSQTTASWFMDRDS